MYLNILSANFDQGTLSKNSNFSIKNLPFITDSLWSIWIQNHLHLYITLQPSRYSWCMSHVSWALACIRKCPFVPWLGSMSTPRVLFLDPWVVHQCFCLYPRIVHGCFCLDPWLVHVCLGLDPWVLHECVGLDACVVHESFGLDPWVVFECLA